MTFTSSLAEAAIVFYSPPRLLEIARKRNRDAAVRAFIEADERILLTCRTLAVVGMVAFAFALLLWLSDGGAVTGSALLGAGALAAALLLTVVRVLPLYLGRIFPEPVLLVLRPLLVPANLLLSPVTWPLYLFRRLTERLAGRPVEGDGPEHFQEEILSAVEEGEMEGAIGEGEADMIERALNLSDADAADAMTPRTDMFCLEIDTPLDEAVARVREAGHSRVPVYEETPDRIVGVLYAKDILEHWGRPRTGDLDLATIVRKPFFVPETKKIGALLDEFKRAKLHLAVVLDEYGGTAGVITIEDILEEIVGEIEDEYDEGEDRVLLERIGEGGAEVDARLRVDELADALDVELPSDEYDSVGGLVFTVLGRIPDPGDEFEYEGLRFTVLDADVRRVSRVRVQRMQPAP